MINSVNTQIGATGLMALAEAPLSHSLTDELQMQGIMQDVPFIALAYANLVVFSALLFCLFSLSAISAIAYVLTAFTGLALVSALSKLATQKFSKIWSVAALGVACELALSSILVFDFFAVERTQLVPAVAIVASVSFVSVPLIAHFIKPFLATKLAVVILCSAYVLSSPSNIAKTSVIAALIIALLLMVSMGYWLIRRRRGDIRLRLQLMDLNEFTEHQNEKLARSFEAIQHAKQQSEQDFALRQRLLSYIGHDLRQPVNAAGYILREMASRNKDSGMVDLISDAQECIQSTSNMISDVVQITHYDNPKIDVQFEDISLGPILSQITRESLISAKLAGSQIRYVPTSLVVIFDAELLARILRNLIRNAIKHAQAKDILIGVRRDAQNVYLCIIDNGSGMPDLPSETQGLGLGLKISHQLAAICGGQLSIESEFGQGTMCKVIIPRSNGV